MVHQLRNRGMFCNTHVDEIHQERLEEFVHLGCLEDRQMTEVMLVPTCLHLITQT